MGVKSYEVGEESVLDGQSSGNSSPEPKDTLEAIQREVKEEAKRRRKKKRRSERTLVASMFTDLYTLTGEILGEGSFGKVETCVSVYTGIEYAAKTIKKRPGYDRGKVLKEIEAYHVCQGHPNIIQLIEYFEEDNEFYLIFEKIHGGPLLDHIQKRICFTEAEASAIIRDMAEALKFLHSKGIAHRDLKPENVLCVDTVSPCPVKLCDFDLCSAANNPASTPQLLTPVGSVEYMAPEVVDTFMVDVYDVDDDDNLLYYDKKCDLWSLGIIMYILLCGYAPFSGNCGTDCGWERGESCPECQDQLFNSIKRGNVVFPDSDWDSISSEAIDLIGSLLVKEAVQRLDAEEVLDDPWIVNKGCGNRLDTPRNLRRQTSIKELADFAVSAMAVNRAVVEERNSERGSAGGASGAAGDHAVSEAVRIPWRRETWSFDLSPPLQSNCALIQRRRKSGRLSLAEKKSKFSSIDELELERDLFMKAII